MTNRLNVRSFMLLIGVVMMTGMLAACDDTDGAGGTNPVPPAAPPAD